MALREKNLVRENLLEDGTGSVGDARQIMLVSIHPSGVNHQVEESIIGPQML